VTADDYRKQLEKLLPQGLAYKRDPGSIIVKLLEGMAEELARVDARASDLILEADPRTASELFQDWLRVVGIPDACSIYAAGSEDERLQLLEKLTSEAGQGPEVFRNVAEALGYTGAEVVEYFPFRVDLNTCEDPLYDEAWGYAFSVVIQEAPLYFRAGANRAGDYLTTSSAELLDCIIKKSKPAHTIGFVGYAEEL
jgi:uncharacterized protein YmfQ (DUF2313 family)